MLPETSPRCSPGVPLEFPTGPRDVGPKEFGLGGARMVDIWDPPEPAPTTNFPDFPLKFPDVPLNFLIFLLSILGFPTISPILP